MKQNVCEVHSVPKRLYVNRVSPPCQVQQTRMATEPQLSLSWAVVPGTWAFEGEMGRIETIFLNQLKQVLSNKTLK